MEMLRDQVTNPVTGETRRIPPGVIIREGIESDLDSVIKLCKEVNFLDGCDFLPAAWRDDCRDPNRILVVADVDNQVVAVVGTIAANKGQHWIGYAARCSPRYQQNNIYWACNAYLSQLAPKRFGRQLKSFGVTGNIERFEKHLSVGATPYKLAFKGTHFFICKNTPLATFLPAKRYIQSLQLPSANLTEIRNAEEFAVILKDESARRDLFPYGYFNIMYACYEAIPQTAYDVWKKEGHKVLIENVNSQPKSISICSSHSVQNGQIFIIEIYGHLDFKTILAHIGFHFKYVESCAGVGDNVDIVLAVPNAVEIDKYVNLFNKQLGLSDGDFGVGGAVGMVRDNQVKAKY